MRRNVIPIDRLYKTLTKKRFNRDAPSYPTALHRLLSWSVGYHQPLQLVSFWGVGPRPQVNQADVKACDFLHSLTQQIRAVYPPGVKLHCIFATMHGRHNGILTRTITTYTQQMAGLFTARDISFSDLERLWQKHGLSFEMIDQQWQAKSANWWASIPNHVEMEQRAAKHNHRLPAQEAAQKYVIMRMLEKDILVAEYPQAIFCTYSSRTEQVVLPPMPTLHLYSLKKGCSQPPWFMTNGVGQRV